MVLGSLVGCFASVLQLVLQVPSPTSPGPNQSFLKDGGDACLKQLDQLFT